EAAGVVGRAVVVDGDRVIEAGRVTGGGAGRAALGDAQVGPGVDRRVGRGAVVGGDRIRGVAGGVGCVLDECALGRRGIDRRGDDDRDDLVRGQGPEAD